MKRLLLVSVLFALVLAGVATFPAGPVYACSGVLGYECGYSISILP